LIFLAGLMRYYSTTDFVVMKEIPDSILWNLMADFSIAGIFTIFESDLAQYTENHILSDDSIFYLLPLKAVEDFRYLYPENSYELFKYLDEKEKNY